MQWKVFIFLMLTAHVAGFMCAEAQSIFDPFGLRNRGRARMQSSAQYDEEDGDEEEGDNHSSIRIPVLDFLNFGFRSDRDRQRGRNRGRHRERNRKGGNENDASERDSFEVPEARTGLGNSQSGTTTNNGNKRDKDSSSTKPSEETNTSDSESSASGPCGDKNQLCHGENYIKELGLKWSKRVQNGTGIYLRDPNAPGGKRFVLVGIDMPNDKFGQCKTPDELKGYCRHLEHCVQDEFRSDFITFLQYMCDIPNQNYVGVCCPIEERKEARTTRRPSIIPDGRDLLFPPWFRPQATTTAPSHRRRTTRQPRTRIPSNPPGTQKDCGMSQRKMPRIVGGRVADPKAWPWMAAILKKEDAVDYRAGQYCGGVLISEFHVLTAGHCVDGFEINGLAVRIGEYDFSRDDDTPTRPQDIDIAEIFIHEEYNRYTYQNDIAIIKLAKSAFFDSRISAICLPRSEDADKSLTNEPGIVTGFGTIYYGGPASDVLMEITVPIWSREECQAAYTQKIEETNLCAGARAGSKDSCQGDSGGPLQVQLHGRWTTVGIVSWGIRCSEPGFPGVYSRVASYLKWISSRMRY